MAKPLSAALCILGLLAAVPANAAGLAGKWYGRVDSEPVITIAQAGAGYSASLDYPDINKAVMRGIISYPETIHREVISFTATDGHVRFAIRSLASVMGDINYARDEYDLRLSADGGQLTGTLRHTIYNEGPDQPRTAIGPVTLFPSDWASRNGKP